MVGVFIFSWMVLQLVVVQVVVCWFVSLFVCLVGWLILPLLMFVVLLILLLTFWLVVACCWLYDDCW